MTARPPFTMATGEKFLQGYCRLYVLPQAASALNGGVTTNPTYGGIVGINGWMFYQGSSNVFYTALTASPAYLIYQVNIGCPVVNDVTMSYVMNYAFTQGTNNFQVSTDGVNWTTLNAVSTSVFTTQTSVTSILKGYSSLY